jgi:two-component system CheB/CheR fusion protein
LHIVSDREHTLACWRAACADQGDYDLEYRIRRHDGVYHWFRTRGVPVRDEQGKIAYWFGTCTDIEDYKRLEAALREADRRKNEFLATLAHELRNPLAPIRNGLQVLRLTDDSAARERAREMMERQLAQLVRLVDDLLDISRISRNRLELRKARITLAAVVENAVETARPLIESKGHALIVTLPPEPVYLDADLTRLAQVFGNLLNNSAKYTDPGGRIELIAQVNGRIVTVKVRDDGIGIPAEDQPRIFEIFSQVDHGIERSQGGLGIGLTLVQGLVEMHDGSVEIHSAGTGQGSEFAVRLPVARSNRRGEQPAGRVSHVTSTRRRILVVDDNRDAVASLVMMLSILGHDTRTAHDGHEAVEQAEAFRPDVILLDLDLPKLNGYDVCRRIRQNPWGQGMIIVAATGWGQEEDRQRSHEAGFNHHMVKPVDPVALEQILASVTPATRP